MPIMFARSQVACAACNVMYDPIDATQRDADEIPCAYYPARHVPPPEPHPLVSLHDAAGRVMRNKLGDPIMVRE